MPDDLARRMAHELAAVRWPDAEEIRAIGRRRTRRATVAATLSVLLTVSVAWAAVGRPGWPPRSEPAPVLAEPLAAPASAGPEATGWIPPEALLTPEDVGPGLVAGQVTTDQNRPVGRWAFTLHTCPAYPAVKTYQGVYTFRREQTVGFPPKVPGEPETGVAVLRQSVMRLSPDGAAEMVTDAREVTRACAKYESSGVLSAFADDGTGAGTAKQLKVRTTHAWQLVDENFAGDESLLFEHQIVAETGKDRTDLGAASVAVIRVRDLVATVEQVDGGGVEVTRRLGKRAAAWLCTAATPPC